MKKVLIWGAGGHATVVAEILRLTREWEIVGYLDDLDPGRTQTPFNGGTIVGTSERLPELKAAGVEGIALAVGNCPARLKMLVKAREQGFRLVKAVHPRAVVSEAATVGEGTIVAAGTVVNPGARIGEGVIINTSASVDHDCLIEDGAHICPGVHLAGGVRIGRGAWIGIGAVVKERVEIGADAVIGAGAVVLRNIPPAALAYGVPARIIKQHE